MQSGPDLFLKPLVFLKGNRPTVSQIFMLPQLNGTIVRQDSAASPSLTAHVAPNSGHAKRMRQTTIDVRGAIVAIVIGMVQFPELQRPPAKKKAVALYYLKSS